jgi:carboxymethylenebutenolidase
MTLLADACPIIASYGARDRSLAKAPTQLEQVLTANRVVHDIRVYPGAGHGFLNDHAPGKTPLWALVAGKFAHTGYHQPSAADARQRIVTFFSTHLRPTP